MVLYLKNNQMFSFCFVEKEMTPSQKYRMSRATKLTSNTPWRRPAHRFIFVSLSSVSIERLNILYHSFSVLAGEQIPLHNEKLTKGEEKRKEIEIFLILFESL